jgi:polyhydroxyalkanoate synthesis regulator phasin
MEDLFKKFINAGVGFVSLTTDRVQKTIDTLVQESKLSEQEGAKIMDELKQNGETKRKELEKQVQSIASRVMKSVGVAPNSDVEELKRTVKGGSKSAAEPKADAPKAAAPKAGKPTVNSPVGVTNVSSSEGRAAAAKKTVTTPATSTVGKVKSAGSKSNPNSKEDKAKIEAAKKAISPNDNTSSTGSTLS